MVKHKVKAFEILKTTNSLQEKFTFMYSAVQNLKELFVTASKSCIVQEPC